jgi:hypothetical protein
MKDCQSPRHLRAQEPYPIPHASGLLLDRWPQSRTGNRPAVGNRKGRPARVESACRRLAFRNVQPNESERRGGCCRCREPTVWSQSIAGSVSAGRAGRIDPAIFLASANLAGRVVSAPRGASAAQERRQKKRLTERVATKRANVRSSIAFAVIFVGSNLTVIRSRNYRFIRRKVVAASETRASRITPVP